MSTKPKAVKMTRAMYNLPEMLAGDELCDITVEVNSEQFKLHKVILASCSDFFRAMFNSNMEETTQDVVPLCYDSLTTDAFKILIEFAYNSELKLTPENVFEVVMASDHLQMLSAMTRCGEYLLSLVDDMTIPVSHLITVHEFVSKFNLKRVLKKVTQCMATRFTTLADSREFLESFTFENLMTLLDRDDLAASSEAEIFKKVLKWVESDEENRIECLDELLKRVRLPLIDPDELTELMDHERFRKLPCFDLYISTLKYHSSLSITGDWKKMGLNKTPRNSIKVFTKVTCFQSKYTISCRHDNQWTDINSRRFNIHHRSEYVQSVVIGNTLIVVHQSGAMHKFEPADREWKELQPMKESRKNFPLIHDGGEFLYAIGGQDKDGHPLRASERYNLHTGKWQRIAPLPHTDEICTATLYNDRILFLCKNSGHSFDAEKNTWDEVMTYEADYTFPIFSSEFDGRLHLFKTWSGIQVYDPDNEDNVWEDITQKGVPDMWRTRAFCGVDGQVYIVGGTKCYNTGVTADASDPYDVDIDNWKWMMETAEKSNIVEISIPMSLLP
ncbi:kelch-like protein 23 [Glandiceps talaboti]